MATKRETIVAKAQAYVGIKEGSAAHKAIIDKYNNHKPLARGYAVKYTDAWCATFISYLAIVCNATDIIPTECGCEEMIQLFKARGIWKENDNYKPTAADIIFYDWDDSGKGDNTGWTEHVGIVEKVEGNKITVIEGNKNNAVSRREIVVGGKYIRGYGVPQYTKNYNVVSALKVGDKVIVKDGAKTYTNQSLAPFVYGREHKVLEIKGDRVVITYRGVVVCAIRKTDLKKV